MCGPEGQGVLEPSRLDVHGDDRMRGDHGAALHDVETDTAGAENGHGGARGHTRGVEHGADARHDRAAHEGGAVQRHGGVDADGGRFVDDGARGVGGDVAIVVDGLPAEGHPRGAVGQEPAPRQPLLAEVGAADHAIVAAATGRCPRKDDVVAGLELTNARSHALDRARALVAQHDGHGHPFPASVGGVETAVADAARGHPHEHFTLARPLEVELLDPERRALLEENRSFHGRLRGMCGRPISCSGCGDRASCRGGRRQG